MISMSRMDENGKPTMVKCCGRTFEELGFKKHVAQVHSGRNFIISS